MLLPFVLLTACLNLHATGETAADDAATPSRSPSAAGAVIGFANLADGDVVPPTFIVRFTISGMGIAPAGSRIDNTGHFHLLIDLAELPAMDQPLPATPNIRHYGKGQTEAPLDLAAGEHTLQLLLADYAHVPHDPQVISKRITITVANDAPPPADH
jgi:hypothetical protein